MTLLISNTLTVNTIIISSIDATFLHILHYELKETRNEIWHGIQRILKILACMSLLIYINVNSLLMGHFSSYIKVSMIALGKPNLCLVSNIAINAWLPQASYPCGDFSDTSSFISVALRY